MTDHLDRIGGRTRDVPEEETKLLEGVELIDLAKRKEHAPDDCMCDGGGGLLHKWDESKCTAGSPAGGTAAMTEKKPVKFTLLQSFESEPCPNECGDDLNCPICGIPKPSGYVYERPSREGDPLKVIADLRKALGEVTDLLEQAEGTLDCCQGGITESYCGMFGCTPDGCYGHEQDCPCDKGTAVRYLLEMADA